MHMPRAGVVASVGLTCLLTIGCGTPNKVSVDHKREDSSCAAWCIEDPYSVNCQGQGTEVLDTINPDSDVDDTPADDLYGCNSNPGEYPSCNESHVPIDGVECNPQCQEDGTCSDGLVVLKHKPGMCYGACGPKCRGCCAEHTAYCRPPAFWIDGGINAGTGLPNGCTFVGNVGGLKRVTCGKTAFDYFNVGKDLKDAGMVAAAAKLRTKKQSTNSLGACPNRDWTAAVPQSFVAGGVETFSRNPEDTAPKGGKTYAWTAIGLTAQACSVHSACYAHDECNRHDKLRYLECTLFGELAAGKAAVKGTPTVDFNYGWWASDGSLRVDGPNLQFPEPKTTKPEASQDPKLDCYYDFDPAKVTMAVTNPYPISFPLRTHAMEQVNCPIHNRKH